MSSSDAELAAEQAYVQWAIERIDTMIVAAERVVRSAGDVGAARAVLRSTESRVAALKGGRQEPVFGRLDMTFGETFYVGKMHIDGVGREAVIDWRTPMGGRFYEASADDAREVGRRRTIQMRGQHVKAISDETLTAGFRPAAAGPVVVAPPVDVEVDVPVETVPTPIDVAATEPVVEPQPSREPEVGRVPDEIAAEAVTTSPEHPDTGALVSTVAEPTLDLRAEDILLSELEEARTGTMGDIVATIQADQNRLIRADHDRPLLVQGSPGTGKTIVGLHRAAYVLYQQYQAGQDQSVLVIGPNDRFVEYIGQVLPSLGETTAVEMSLGRLLRSGLSRSEQMNVVVRANDTERAAVLKGDLRMAATVRAAIWAMTNAEDVQIGYRRFVLRLTAGEVKGIVTALERSGLTYRDACTALVPALVEKLFEKAVGRSGVGESFTDDDRDDLRRQLRGQFEDSRQQDRIMPRLEIRPALNRLLDDPSRLIDASGGWLEESDLEHLERRKRKGTPWTRADLALLDEVADVIARPSQRFGHVVVDEAQDLSPMEWHCIGRRVTDGSITVLGDLAQKTSASPAKTWDELLQPLGLGEVKQLALTTGYRVPSEVLEYADQILPWTVPDQQPTVSFRSTEKPTVILAAGLSLPEAVSAELTKSRAGSVALVTAPGSVDTWSDHVASLALDSDVHVLDPEGIKGLEFDHVVVVEPADIVDAATAGLQLLYVALTRPTKTLTVVHSQLLPPALDGRVPTFSPRRRRTPLVAKPVAQVPVPEESAPEPGTPPEVTMPPVRTELPAASPRPRPVLAEESPVLAEESPVLVEESAVVATRPVARDESSPVRQGVRRLVRRLIGRR